MLPFWTRKAEVDEGMPSAIPSSSMISWEAPKREAGIVRSPALSLRQVTVMPPSSFRVLVSSVGFCGPQAQTAAAAARTAKMFFAFISGMLKVQDGSVEIAEMGLYRELGSIFKNLEVHLAFTADKGVLVIILDTELIDLVL